LWEHTQLLVTGEIPLNPWEEPMMTCCPSS
jgi:hypothetical protein